MNQYDDIINLPHYELKYHKRMSIESRSSQFAPFSALTGYSDAVSETSRLTNKKSELSDDMKSIIDMKLQIIEENISQSPEISVLYFEKDTKKDGGKYVAFSGFVKKIDKIEKVIIFKDNKKIKLNNIFDIDADFINI